MGTTRVKAVLGHKPKRKPNLVKWMTKHQVSTHHTSLDVGVAIAIESLFNSDRG
ncbi:chromo domain-containing protein [Spongiimicrobium salis]|uniref:hypothetical protein n=1 Tax=Spongiimicrobium salis TaxID=1667022 RepID=UPI00374D2C04